MADDIQIKNGGAGFFDPKSGNLRSKEENKRIESQLQTAVSANQSGAKQLGDVAKTTGNALSAVRDRTNADITKATESVTGSIDDLKSARQQNRKERDILDKLQQAVKSGSSDEAEGLREEFRKARAERRDLAQGIKQRNRQRQESGSNQIKVGNNTIAKIDPIRVEFDSNAGGGEPSLESADDIKALRQSLGEEAQGIGSQLGNAREVRGQVRKAASEAREEIRDIKGASDATVRDYEEAKSLADNISQKIKSGGQATFESASLNNLNPKSNVINQLFK